MIVAVDIGNTTIEVGIIKDIKNIQSYRFSADKDKTEDEWYFLFSFFLQPYKKIFKAGIISSVVPSITNRIKSALNRLLEKDIFVAGEDINFPIKINYENPKEVGSDRIINAIAVINLYKLPALVIDFGTAITFDYINSKGEYEGGAIFPGIKSSTQVLFQKTAKLPLVTVKKQPNVLGKNTVQSIQTGIYNGYISMIEGMIKLFKKQCKCKSLNIILTGGDADLFSKGLKVKHIKDDLLSMKGMYFMYRSFKD